MWWIVILLVIVGITMLVLEILVIPGAGVAGVVGLALMGTGVWIAYTRLGTTEGNIVLLSSIAFNIVGVTLALRSKTWNKAMLNTEITSKVNTIDINKLNVGDKGVSISRCAPMGKALFGDEYVEVTALSSFIDQETDIEIIKISGNKIYIKQINKK